ncbi:hypothetical protein NQ317_007832 [Molorchus minor]|uniref:Uncharacterized protein n=1 Tax=Molorchus minor TaxID=1323400 RepID=A0ABQ9K4N5_9CUCU|nr:hypothetical protein NQ317_007832 [Molorchus minor]
MEVIIGCGYEGCISGTKAPRCGPLQAGRRGISYNSGHQGPDYTTLHNKIFSKKSVMDMQLLYLCADLENLLEEILAPMFAQCNGR